MTALPLTSTIGIIGGGQLARMLACAAYDYGYPCHIYTDQMDSSAAQVCPNVTVASYHDQQAVAAFAKTVDVVTCEFENVPAATLETMAQYAPVYPRANCLEIAQDRLKEKAFIQQCGVALPRYWPIKAAQDVENIDFNGAAILKTATLGYDGKGQQALQNVSRETLLAAFEALGCVPCVLEEKVSFSFEASILVARDAAHNIVTFPPSRNVHEAGILRRSVCDQHFPADIAIKMAQIGKVLAAEMQLIGLLAIECFVLDDDRVLVNEMAPRPHNSYHHSLQGCNISQFHQLVRVLAKMPLLPPQRIVNTIMHNLIGDTNTIAAWQQDPNAHIHLYGKAPRAGRKLGHVTQCRVT